MNPEMLDSIVASIVDAVAPEKIAKEAPRNKRGT